MMKTNPENSFRHNWGRRFNKVGGATNVKAIQQAIKGRREGFNQSLRKAEVKTGTYNRFGGVPVRFEAAKAKLEDELKYMPSKVTGREMDKIETEMLAKYGVGKQGRLLEAEASKIMSDNGWVDDEDHRRAALRQVIATNGPNNLFLKYKGFTEHFKDEDQIVRTEGIARNFLKDAKSQRARVDLEATDGYGRLIPVASSAVGTPGQAGAAGQGGAGGQGGTGGQGTTARPPVRSLPEQIKDIAAIAGEDKADLIVEKIVGSIDVGDIDISLLTKDLQPREANEIKAQANQFGKMIEEERETTGGKEKVDDLSNGLFRIKEIMEDLKTGDISQIERAIRSSMGPPIDLSLPGDEKDASVTASTGERKISIHALDALQKLTEKNPERTSLDPASFDAQSHSLINDEVENQRSAVVRGTTASQKTLSEVAAASGNLPLENLDLERVLEKLNQNLEELNDSVGGVAHSAANPLSELRGAGIGAIADRKALEDLLKSAQSGLRDDLRGAKQSVFDKGYTGKDSLANPAVMRAFSDELTTRLVKRLSNAPLKAQVTNLPRSPLAGQRTSAAPTPAPVQPQAQTAPTQNQSRPVRTTRTPVYTAPPPARETARPQVQTAPPPTIRTRPPRPKL